MTVGVPAATAAAEIQAGAGFQGNSAGGEAPNIRRVRSKTAIKDGPLSRDTRGAMLSHVLLRGGRGGGKRGRGGATGVESAFT